MIKDFRDLKVWQKAVELFEDVVRDVEKFPRTEAARVISSQLIRSISSISANIAEGYGRCKGKEYEHYLYIARGSTSESLDWFEKLKRIGYISDHDFELREKVCVEIRAMLSKMISTINKR